MKLVSFLTAIVIAVIAAGVQMADAAPRLKVSENKRFLVKEDGSPFFYLGDTAWELFHRLNREEADKYLDNRAKKGFTVIQAVAIAELDGHADPNPYGYLPLVELDPARPDVKDGRTTITGITWITSLTRPSRSACSSASPDLGPILAR
jgi:hypothetical protein